MIGLTAASRVESAAIPKRFSIVARIEVVSYVVWSTPDPASPAEMTSAGMRVPGPQISEIPLSVGGET